MKKYEEQRRFKLKIGQPDFEVRSPSQAPSDTGSAWPLLNQVAKSSRGEPIDPPSDWHQPDTVDFAEDEYRWHPHREVMPAGEDARSDFNAFAPESDASYETSRPDPQSRAAATPGLRLGGAMPSQGRRVFRDARAQAGDPETPDWPVREPRARAPARRLFAADPAGLDPEAPAPAARDHAAGNLAGARRAAGDVDPREALRERAYRERAGRLRPVPGRIAGDNGTPLKSLLKNIASRRQYPPHGERP